MGFGDKRGKLVTLKRDDSIPEILVKGLSNNKNLKTSYKYAFFYAIIQNINNVDEDLRMNLDDLTYSFASIYWDIVNKYDLPICGDYSNIANGSDDNDTFSDMRKTVLQYSELVRSTKYDFNMLPEDKLREYLDHSKAVMTSYVIGVLYEHFDGKLYSFDKNENFISISKEFRDYIAYNKTVVNNLNSYYFTLWIEKKLNKMNKDERLIANHIDDVTRFSKLN